MFGFRRRGIAVVVPAVLALVILSAGSARAGELDDQLKRSTLFGVAAMQASGAEEDYEGTIAMFTQGHSDNAYLDYARATGVIGMIDDPRVRPSWAR